MVPVITGKSPVITGTIYSITANVYSKPSIPAVILPNVPVTTAGVPVIMATSGGITEKPGLFFQFLYLFTDKAAQKFVNIL
jgi:hypothetical protein